MTDLKLVTTMFTYVCVIIHATVKLIAHITSLPLCNGTDKVSQILTYFFVTSL